MIILLWNYLVKFVIKKYGIVVYCRKYYFIVYCWLNVRKLSGEGLSLKGKEKEWEDVLGEKWNVGYFDMIVIDVLKDVWFGGDVFSFRVINMEGMVKIILFSILMEKCVGFGYVILKRVFGIFFGKKDDVLNFEFLDFFFLSLYWFNKVGEIVIFGLYNVEDLLSLLRGFLLEEEFLDERVVNVNEVIINLMILYILILLDIGNKGNSSIRK